MPSPTAPSQSASSPRFITCFQFLKVLALTHSPKPSPLGVLWRDPTLRNPVCVLGKGLHCTAAG